MTAIKLRSLGKCFLEPGGTRRNLFVDADFTVAPGDQSVAILGRSGSGKSTFLNIMAGLDLKYSGEYLYEGQRLARNELTMSRFRRDLVGIVTQRYDLLPERTALQNVELGFNGSRQAARAAAVEALERTGIGALRGKPVRLLSGGEAQRVSIARAIVKKPLIILADEPTGALDEGAESDILDLFADLQEEGATLIIATHSERVASVCTKRVMISQCRFENVPTRGR